MHAIALLLELDDFTVRPEALVGIENLGEMAVCPLVACGSVNQALICRWSLACRSHAGTIVLAVNSPAFSTTGVS